MNISIRNLEYFVSVAETKSFAASAERLYVSKSALSRGILALEDELGCTLFNRGTRGATLTQEGSNLLIFAKNIVNECESMMNYISGYRDNPAGIIRFGLNDNISTNLLYLRMLFSIMSRDYPEIELMSSNYTTEELIQMLDSGLLDVIITGRIIARHMTDVKIKTAYTDSISIFVNSSSPLAKRKSIKFSELDGSALMLCRREQNPEFFKYVVKLCSDNHILPEFKICDFREIKLRASIGEGVGLMPFYDPNVNYSMPELVTVPVDLGNDDFDRVLVRKTYNKSRCSDILFDIIDTGIEGKRVTENDEEEEGI